MLREWSTVPCVCVAGHPSDRRCLRRPSRRVAVRVSPQMSPNFGRGSLDQRCAALATATAANTHTPSLTVHTRPLCSRCVGSSLPPATRRPARCRRTGTPPPLRPWLISPPHPSTSHARQRRSHRLQQQRPTARPLNDGCSHTRISTRVLRPLCSTCCWCRTRGWTLWPPLPRPFSCASDCTRRKASCSTGR